MAYDTAGWDIAGRASGSGTTPGTRCWQRATTITVSRCRLRETVPAVETDETRPRQGPHPPQAIGVFLMQNDIFYAPRAHGLDQASPGPELGGQRRHARERGGDHDRVEWGMLWGPFGPISYQDDDIAGACVARLRWPRSARSGQISMLTTRAASRASSAVWVAVAGADFEHLLRTVQAQRRDQHGAQRRLGGHLIVRNRHGPVAPRENRRGRISARCGSHWRGARSRYPVPPRLHEGLDPSPSLPKTPKMTALCPLPRDVPDTAMTSSPRRNATSLRNACTSTSLVAA